VPGKIETFGYGFVLDSCSDKYPLEFKIQTKWFDEKSADFVLEGRIINPKNSNYLMAMELLNNPESSLKIGYNKDGDVIGFKVHDTISVQDGFQFLGEVYVQRNNLTYFLTSKSSNKKYLMNTF